ncbi:MAG: hypothetical protein U0X87_18105 [Anaerolineales bacterium]
MPAKKYSRIGMIARWKPVHIGHAAILRALCNSREAALIGVGEVQIATTRATRSRSMKRATYFLVLAEFSNFQIIRSRS